MGVWDFYEKIYDKLWIQKVSLEPTRKCIIKELEKIDMNEKTILDVGCGTGQLLDDIHVKFPSAVLSGVEPSKMGNAAEKKGFTIVKATIEEFQSEAKYDVVICTHSFPYYSKQEKAFFDLLSFVKPGGLLLIANACNNTFYDKLALMLVELTTSKAHYPSQTEMLELIEHNNKKSTVIQINAWYVPSIQLFIVNN